MSDPIYDLQGVAQIYDGRRVLELESLTIGEFESVALLGPNGAGKSTLLRLLNFLEPPAEGRITYAGRTMVLPASLEVRREITTVFQRPVLLSRSVQHNVTYGLRLRRREPGTGLAALMRQLDLERLAHVPANRLSGGEMQRVALARALALEPRVLLLDEPTANLDPYSVGLVEQMIQSLRGAGRTTVVLVTHNVFQARRLADRVGLLLGGRLIELAATEQLFTEPVDPRVGAFLRGEMVC